MADNPTRTPAQMTEAILSKEFITTGIGPITALAESHRDLLAALKMIREGKALLTEDMWLAVRAALDRATGGAA